MRKDEHFPATVITYTVYSRFESNENLLWSETVLNVNIVLMTIGLFYLIYFIIFFFFFFLGGGMCFL